MKSTTDFCPWNSLYTTQKQDNVYTIFQHICRNQGQSSTCTVLNVACVLLLKCSYYNPQCKNILTRL